jgi:hypothetical protein
MASQYIFRSQLNQLLKVLIDSQLGGDAFVFDTDLSKTNLQVKLPIKVTHQASYFYFKADVYVDVHKRPKYFSCTLRPGSTPDVETLFLDKWDSVVGKLRQWVKTIEKEISEPDPWALLKQARVLDDGIPTGQQDQFTDAEIERVKEHLAAVREFLIDNAKPDQEQLKRIDERLSYLEESARRQSKQDWAHTAVGVTFTIAIGLALAPDQANKLFHLTAAFLQTIFIKLLT